MLPRTHVLATAFGLVAFFVAFWLSYEGPGLLTGDDAPIPPAPETAAEQAELLDLAARAEVAAGASVMARLDSLLPSGAATLDLVGVEPAEEDSEWKGLPRSKWRFSRRVWWTPEKIRAIDLFRHVELNPLDKYVPPELRQGLQMLVDAHRQRLVQTASLKNRVRRKEVELAIERGTARRYAKWVRTIDGRSALRLPDNDGGDILHVDSEGGILVKKKYLPVSSKVREYEQFLALELGGQIVNWFEQMGLCSSSDSSRLLGQLFSRVK